MISEEIEADQKCKPVESVQIIDNNLKDLSFNSQIKSCLFNEQPIHENIQLNSEAMQTCKQQEPNIQIINNQVNQFFDQQQISRRGSEKGSNIDQYTQIIRFNEKGQQSGNKTESLQLKSQQIHEIFQQWRGKDTATETQQQQKKITNREDSKNTQQPSKIQEFNQQREQNKPDSLQNFLQGQQVKDIKLNSFPMEISVPKNIQPEQIKKVTQDASLVKLSPQQTQIVFREPREISSPENGKDKLECIDFQWSSKIQKQEPLLSRYTPFASLQKPRPSLFPPFVKSVNDVKVQLSPPPIRGDKKPKPWEKLGVKKVPSILAQFPPISTINSEIIGAVSAETAKDGSQGNPKQLPIFPKSVVQSIAPVIDDKISNHQLSVKPDVSNEAVVKANEGQLKRQAESTAGLSITKGPTSQIKIQAPFELNINKQQIQGELPTKSENSQLKQNPLSYYQRFVPSKDEDKGQRTKEEEGNGLLGLQKPIQQIQKQAQFSAERLQQLQAKPLSDKSSDESGVIIRDSSFQRDNIQKMKQKSKLIEELQIQIRQQEELNRQLENHSSIPIKLAISAAAACTAGGLFLVVRKNRAGALLVGLAASVATFLLKK